MAKVLNPVILIPAFCSILVVKDAFHLHAKGIVMKRPQELFLLAGTFVKNIDLLIAIEIGKSYAGIAWWGAAL